MRTAKDHHCHAVMFLGIDPGKSGAIAQIDAEGNPMGHVALKETELDISEWLRSRCPHVRYAVIEKVGATPQMGVVSSFKFGQSLGICLAFLAAFQIPHLHVSPQRWQGKMDCLSGGDKNVTKRKAQELWPKHRFTHTTADAYLMAEYARRISTRSLLSGGE